MYLSQGSQTSLNWPSHRDLDSGWGWLTVGARTQCSKKQCVVFVIG